MRPSPADVLQAEHSRCDSRSKEVSRKRACTKFVIRAFEYVGQQAAADDKIVEPPRYRGNLMRIERKVGAMSNPRLGLTLILCALLSLLTVPAATSPAIATVQIAVVASGAGNLTYQWYRAGVAVAGQTSSSISVPSSDASLYTVVVKDADGSTQTAGATVTVSTPVPVPPPPPSTTVGPRGPVGPQASVTCTGTQLAAGANIQSAVTAAPEGTTFCLAAGTYSKQTVKPKAGDKFIGAFGAIIDGGGSAKTFMDGATVVIANITLQNLVVQNYIGGYQSGPVLTSTGWSVLNNEFRNNDGVGVGVSSNTLLQYNYIHHNAEMGIGNYAGNAQVLDNEIAFNNYQDKYNCGNECGGGKFAVTNGLVFSYNYSHDNHGPGIWSDINNQNITYSFNRIENNYSSGIFHEISYNASIHDNVILNNGKQQGTNPPCTWLWCAGVLIAESGGVAGGSVEIYNNTIAPGSQYGNAIGLVQQSRGSGTLGAYLVQNVWVHDNTIDLSKGGNVGGVQDNDSKAMFSSSGNNRFDRNHYIGLVTTATPWQFWWHNTGGGKAFWQSQGMDLNGTFN